MIFEWIKNIDKEKLAEMGCNGLKEIKDRYSKSIVTRQYCELVENL